MLDIEAVCVRIPLTTGNIYVYCLYLQPTANIDTYRTHVGAIHKLFNDAGKSDTILVLGDFNFGNAAAWHENDNGLISFH